LAGNSLDPKIFVGAFLGRMATDAMAMNGFCAAPGGKRHVPTERQANLENGFGDEHLAEVRQEIREADSELS
jgi:hypothetical protein